MASVSMCIASFQCLSQVFNVFRLIRPPIPVPFLLLHEEEIARSAGRWEEIAGAWALPLSTCQERLAPRAESP